MNPDRDDKGHWCGHGHPCGPCGGVSGDGHGGGVSRHGKEGLTGSSDDRDESSRAKPQSTHGQGRGGPSHSGGRIGAAPGYPETGKTSWRAANDQTFANTADANNKKYHLTPADDEYINPEFMKAWAIVESGGEGDKDAFLRDPLQVNNPGDWDREKRSLGLAPGQAMTPQRSAAAALEWLRYKGYERDGKSNRVRWRGKEEALRRYNGSKRRNEYAKKVMDLWQKMLKAKDE